MKSIGKTTEKLAHTSERDEGERAVIIGCGRRVWAETKKMHGPGFVYDKIMVLRSGPELVSFNLVRLVALILQDRTDGLVCGPIRAKLTSPRPDRTRLFDVETILF
jgi:hypothetical protein